MNNSNRSHLFALLLLFFVLCLIYAWATPVFEASDELWHFGLIDSIANTHALPVQVPKTKTAWAQEGSQPPLYYLISAVLVSPIDRSDIDQVRQPNPHAKAGIPGDVDNKNLVLHPTPHPPLEKTVLAVYLVRLFSILLGMVTITMVYASARLILPEKPRLALIAAALTAFNPMFLFITASVNNDNLVIALNSVITWQLLLMLRDGFSIKQSMLLAVLLALTAISKLSGLVMYPVVALAALWVTSKRHDIRGLLTLGVFTVGCFVALAGWWYVRNLTLYGELFGTRTMVSVAGPRLEPFTLKTLADEFEGFRISYWGLFGAVNVLTANLFYIIMDIVTVLTGIGLALYLWRSRNDRQQILQTLLIALIPIGGIIGVINWTAQTYASQGRLLFPFVAAISSLLVLGLSTIRFPMRYGIAALGAFAFIVPFTSIAPTYATPPVLSGIPDNVRKVYARFENVELVGYTTPDRRYKPGDSVPVTLYWHVLDQSNRDLSLYLHAVNGKGETLGKVDSYPGAGRLQTMTWEKGAIYPDVYAVPIASNAESDPSSLSIQVGWWHYPTESVITAVDNKGQQLSSVMLQAGAFASTVNNFDQPKDFTTVSEAKFGKMIALNGYSFDSTSALTLSWQAIGTPDKNYTVFVQVLDGDNKIVGQGDMPPSFPTKYWQSGEHYLTQHTINYPAPLTSGTYHIVIGWYDPADFRRLDTSTRDGAYQLLTMTK